MAADEASPGFGNGFDNTAENDDVGDDFDVVEDEFELVELELVLELATLLELPKVKFLDVKEGMIGALWWVLVFEPPPCGLFADSLRNCLKSLKVEDFLFGLTSPFDV